MPAPAPSADFQLRFLAKIERLLSEGRFTTTYKFALLLSLTNIAVERGDDTGAELDVALDDIARQFLALYWSMARPYPRINAILKQSTNAAKPSSIISLLGDEVRNSPSSYQRLRIFHGARDRLVTHAQRTLAKDVLYRLQSVATDRGASSKAERFLYDHPPSAPECARLTHITLKPGVSACLRRLRGVITSMVQARWALWVRENNARLAADRGLEQFLFGASRANVAVHAERLHRLQEGRCFYTAKKLASPRECEVDHFIPWARYPFDSPFNLVLASRAINNRFRDRLKPVEHREAWLERNDRHSALLIAPPPEGFGAAEQDLGTARSIAEWLYRVG